MQISRCFRTIAVLILCLLLLTACGSESLSIPTGQKAEEILTEEERFSVQPFQDASFHAEEAIAYEFGSVDFSMIDKGSIAVKADSGKTMKFQISCGDNTYNYNIPSNGDPAIFPLNMGNGEYTFRALEHVGDNKYAQLWKASESVSLIDEFAPFLVPSQMVSYSENSDCVVLAKEIAMTCRTDSDVASAIYTYLIKHIQYDHEKAATVEKGYLPNPDETLSSQKGICFDYASLAAAMMRSLGIPCQLITGYVDQEVYHAWNCFYIEGQGWITAEIKAVPGKWQRVDITFAASGTSAKDLMDDGKYTTRFTY